MVFLPWFTGQVAGSRVLNITTQGGKVIASTTRGTTANVVTVNPKTLQLTAIKGAGGTTGIYSQKELSRNNNSLVETSKGALS